MTVTIVAERISAKLSEYSRHNDNMYVHVRHASGMLSGLRQTI